LTTAILAVAFAVMLSSARLLLPLTENYRVELQEWITEALGRPVVVGRTAARWHRFGPELALYDVELRDEESARSVLRLAEVHIGIDFVTALRQFSIQPTTIRIIGSRLEVERMADGRVQVQGLITNGGAQENSDQATGGAMAWLFSREHLLLEDLDLTLIEQRRKPSRVYLNDIDIELRNSSTRHQLVGRVLLTAGVGESIEFALDAEGGVESFKNWQGDFFLAVKDASLPQFASQHPTLGKSLRGGRGDLTLWGALRQGRVVQLAGRAALTDLEVVHDDARASYTNISGNFAGWREDAGWSVVGDRMVVETDSNDWPASKVTARIRAKSDSHPLAAAARLDYLDIETLIPLIAAFPVNGSKWGEALRKTQPRGTVTNIATQVEFDTPVRYQASARLTSVGMRRWEKIPGALGLSGDLSLDQDSGRLSLKSESLELELPRWFEQPLPVSRVSADLSWRRDGAVWDFGVENAEVRNSDAHAVGLAEAQWNPDRGLFLDLSAHVIEANGGNVPPYLPTKRMPEATVAWLRRGIVGGQVPTGNLVYRGWGREYPFVNGEGRFHIAFDVENAVLDYLPDWPRLEKINASVEFDQTAMRITARHGESMGVKVERAEADIPDLQHDQKLPLSGLISAPVADGVNFLAGTPLTSGFRDTLKGLRTAGDVQVDLKIDAPLKKQAIPSVTGVAKLKDASLGLPDWPTGLESINGSLKFSENLLEAKRLSAGVLSRNATVAIRVPIGARVKTAAQGNITVKGTADAKGLGKVLKHPSGKRLSGETPWRVVWRVPSYRGQKNRVEITSNLSGLALDFPEPLGKQKEEAVPLAVIVDMTRRTQTNVTARLGKRADTALLFSGARGSTRLARGEVRLGGGVAYLPTEKGLLVSGKVDQLSVSEWRDAIGGWGGGWSLDAGPLQRIVLQIGTLSLVEKQTRDVRVALAKVDGYWQGILAGEGVKGSVRVPLSVSDLPLMLNLDHLKLESKPEGTDRDVAIWPNPTNLPPMNVKIGHLWLDEGDLGEVVLTVAQAKEGVRIDQLRVSGEHLTVEARGDWLGSRDRNRTTWEASLQSKNLGTALRTLGFAEGIKGGKTEADVQVSWPGPPSNPDLEGLNGRLSLTVKSGRIVNLDPGAGRIFGLLSVQALPRRLLLDFRDLFMKGFTFDEITGKFRIDSGDAYSDDLVVDGPAATLKIIGRTGIARKDYDQLVKVGPNISGTLPLAGWAVGGPTVGAVMLFFQRILGKDIDEDSGIHYRVTGSWEDPKVVRVESEVPETPDETEAVTAQ